MAGGVGNAEEVVGADASKSSKSRFECMGGSGFPIMFDLDDYTQRLLRLPLSSGLSYNYGLRLAQPQVLEARGHQEDC